MDAEVKICWQTSNALSSDLSHFMGNLCAIDKGSIITLTEDDGTEYKIEVKYDLLIDINKLSDHLHMEYEYVDQLYE